jgi:UDP-N-acetylglucosamine transferase subunit ALG13
VSVPKRVFVTAGHNRPFHRLLRLAEQLAHDPGIELFAQMGYAADAFPTLPGRPFLDKAAFERRIDWADVVITHAGAGAIYDARSVGHLPIVVPRRAALGEHINDHQWDMALALADAKFIRLLSEDDDLGQLVLESSRDRTRTAVQTALVDAVRQDLARRDAKSLHGLGVAQALLELIGRVRPGRLRSTLRGASQRPAGWQTGARGTRERSP